MPIAQQTAGVWWGLGVGLAFAVIIYFTVRSGWYRKSTLGRVPDVDTPPESVGDVHEYPEGLMEGHGRVPLVIKLIIAGFIVFLVYYVATFIMRMQGPLGAFDAFLTK